MEREELEVKVEKEQLKNNQMEPKVKMGKMEV
jgi:hypothetical protein